MSFAMYTGFVVGMIIGIVLVAIGTRSAKKKRGVIEEDERTDMISARASRTTLLGVAIIAFVAWVTENVIRYLNGLGVHFFSPWAVMLFAGFLLYIVIWYYENRRVSDPDTEPDEHDKKRIRVALASLGASICSLSAVLSTASDKVDREVFWFLIGFELLLVAIVGLLFGKMMRKRTRA